MDLKERRNYLTELIIIGLCFLFINPTNAQKDSTTTKYKKKD